MTNKILVWHPEVLPPPRRARRVLARALAVVLRSAGRTLDRLARRLAAGDRLPASMAQDEPVLEFYAEAGAPEGALYVDGRRIGVLPGVTRL